MAPRETTVFIRYDIRKLATAFPESRWSEDGDEARLLFGGSVADGPEFGLAADLSDEGAGSWAQVLHSQPDDPEAIAAALARLDVHPELVSCATTWEGRPLFDVGALRKLLAAKRPSRAS